VATVNGVQVAGRVDAASAGSVTGRLDSLAAAEASTPYRPHAAVPQRLAVHRRRRRRRGRRRDRTCELLDYVVVVIIIIIMSLD